ncbi:ABC transporter ATP-binding protein [Caldilinea sp.]|jgi:peptide/nickel transport system ATP-binding protein|uniref:ABC transporter ATP-binding protein n=1 Tax=Caldilinea sp. TaxID=2293560 RepID=UPI00262082AD|nr:oligopeptide/dipeptide ABC transporter ATP-binding protein [uncultured Caldilinea sp.]
MNGEKKLLQVDRVTVSFHVGGFIAGGRLLAVNNVSFSLDAERPEIFAVAGESGSGKTTLARVLLHDLEPTQGRVVFEGRDLSTIKRRRDAMEFMRKVQPVFQNPFETFSPLRRVEDYLFETAIQFGRAKNRRAAAPIVDEALHQVGLSLEEVRQRYPHELSGGQIQRVSVARALIPQPHLILADEPVSMVDASLRMSIVNLFKKLRDEQKVSVVYITHDLATAYYISDRIAIMLRGVVVESGPVEKVLGNPLHPYTKLLQESVPKPVVTEREQWARPINLGAMEVKEYGRVGCKFAGRCPHVMEICKHAEPPTLEVEGRAVKCYLYGEDAAQSNPSSRSSGNLSSGNLSSGKL